MNIAQIKSTGRQFTLLIIVAFAFFQLLSFGTFPPGANKHITAAVTLSTAGGGDPKDFNSVKFP